MAWWYAIDGQRRCRVRHIDNRLHLDGTVRLTLPLGQVEPGVEWAGMFEVHDEHDGGVYVAQMLTCWHESDAVVLSCTPLGTLVDRPDPVDDDDWLIVPGRDPIRVLSRCEAHSHCPSGDHIRLEVASLDWDTLGWRVSPLSPCVCGGCGADLDRADRAVGGFTVVSAAGEGASPPVVEVVALRPRRRSCITIELACRDESTTTLIGHIQSSVGLSQTPTPPAGKETQRPCALP
ncbi:MAG: hypothetical protein ACIAXF_14060 [Phycisphaerales bacterium JB063]